MRSTKGTPRERIHRKGNPGTIRELNKNSCSWGNTTGHKSQESELTCLTQSKSNELRNAKFARRPNSRTVISPVPPISTSQSILATVLPIYKAVPQTSMQESTRSEQHISHHLWPGITSPVAQSTIYDSKLST